jgi:5'-3' exonuclease
MGVPAFFRKLLKKYKIVRSNPDKPIQALYIDANCLFHPQCFKILELNKDEVDQKRLFEKMANRIIAYIDYLIRVTNPYKLVYISVDGVAPLAKINQQRMRRFGYVNNYRHNIYRKHGVKFNDSWSNIVITPGTQFMYELHLVIRQYYELHLKSNTDDKRTYRIIYDSYLTPGEGEHKILQYLKANTSLTEKDATVIYGLDADLIFLSMASQIPNIYLLREEDQFAKSDDSDDVAKEAIETELCFADIDFTKHSINEEFNEYYRKYITSNNDDYSGANGMFGDDTEDEEKEVKQIKMFDFTNDYIFICYFLGNDFLPHLPSIDITMDGLETLLNCYMDVFQNLGRCLMTYCKNDNRKIHIDTEFLREFITLIATKEEDFFRRIMPDQVKRQRNRRCFESEPHKREIWQIESLKNVKIDDVIRLGDGEADEWKFRYYSHYFHTSEHMNRTVDAVSHNYIEGLLWVARYYFETCPTWRWQYKFTHAPFLSDIMNHIKNKDIMKDFETPVKGPVDMYTQLVSVIPPAYSIILPKTLRHLNNSADSPIIDMFPLTYESDMINKTKLYKCIPMIPYLDVTRVEKAIKKINISESDKNRCIPAEPFDLGISAMSVKIQPMRTKPNHSKSMGKIKSTL